MHYWEQMGSALETRNYLLDTHCPYIVSQHSIIQLFVKSRRIICHL